MRVKYSPLFLSKVKNVDVRIYKSLRKNLAIFIKDSNAPELDNHDLHDEWEGFRSIDINAAWRAIYKEIEEDEEKVAYFEIFGTHKELYGTSN